MSKHLWNLMGILVIAALVLVACGPAATPEPAEEPVEEPVEAPSEEAEEFVFGVILVGPYNDHGWSEAHYTGAEYVTEKLPNARFVYLDKMNSADRPETTLEQAVDDMVSQGARWSSRHRTTSRRTPTWRRTSTRMLPSSTSPATTS